MRLAIVSDIHGNLPALEAVIAEIAQARVDAVLNLGDILSGPLWPLETARRLMALGWPTMRGNHERQVLEDPRERMGASDAFAADALGEAERAWLAGLPTSLRWAGGEVLACHGTPGSDLHYLLETVTPGFGQHGSPGLRAASPAEIEARLGGVHPPVLLCGHSHVPRVVQSGATLIVNPGSVGLPAYDDVHPFPHDVETGSPHARWALLARESTGWRAEQRVTHYDHALSAARAEQAGRFDWADALRSGRVGRRENDAP
ncbi:MAG TPA: metallophosphoesterase family protein [Ideonella sp.]|nr:metallophosphoesterase family protein [Ideonella sp.]